MARARKTGDTFYNARRRYQRSAERYMKQANQSTGATAARYRELARRELNNALSTYDQSTTQNYNKSIQNLSNQLGVNLSLKRQELQSMKQETAAKRRERAKDKSSERLVSNVKDPEQIREQEAKAIFNTSIGSRIIGGLVSIWDVNANRDARGKYDKKKIMSTIFNYFKVSSYAELLQKIEDALGDILYSGTDSEVMYETVKLLIQHKVADNTLVA